MYHNKLFPNKITQQYAKETQYHPEAQQIVNLLILKGIMYITNSIHQRALKDYVPILCVHAFSSSLCFKMLINENP